MWPRPRPRRDITCSQPTSVDGRRQHLQSPALSKLASSMSLFLAQPSVMPHSPVSFGCEVVSPIQPVSPRSAPGAPLIAYLSGPAMPPPQSSPPSIPLSPNVHAAMSLCQTRSPTPDRQGRKRPRREHRDETHGTISPGDLNIQPCVQCAHAGKGDECGRNRRTIGCRRCNTHRLSCSFRAGLCYLSSHIRAVVLIGGTLRSYGRGACLLPCRQRCIKPSNVGHHARPRARAHRDR